MDDQNEYLENTAESLPTPLSKFLNPQLELRHGATTVKSNSNFQLK